MKKTIIIICSIVIVVSAVLLIIQISGLVWVNRLNMNRAYAREIRVHLEEKYEEEFYVQARWRRMGGGFWPQFDVPETVYFYAHPRSDPDHVFRVHVTRQMPGYQIVEIREHYFWRFLRADIQTVVMEHFSDLFGDEMKVDVSRSVSRSLLGFRAGLDHNFALDSFLASGYFLRRRSFTGEEVKRPFSFRISVFIPRFEEEMEAAIIEAANTLVLDLEVPGLLWPRVRIYYIDDMDIYEKIDTSVDEATRFSLSSMHGGVYRRAFWSEGARDMLPSFTGAREIREQRRHFHDIVETWPQIVIEETIRDAGEEYDSHGNEEESYGQ